MLSARLQQGLRFASFGRSIQEVVRRMFFSFFLIPGIPYGLQNFKRVENALLLFIFCLQSPCSFLMACHLPFSGINSPLSAESNQYPYVPDTGSTKTSSPSIYQKTRSLFQELSLNSPPSASALYTETDAAEVGSSGRIITHVTVSTNNASSRLLSSRTRPPCERKKQATVARV